MAGKFEWSAQNGKYYGMPFITQYSVANTLIVMRQDWLDNLGLSYPQTLDEMKDVMLAFTNDDPDGDGQNNTYGYTAEKPGQFDWVFFAYGLPYADYSLDENDQVIRPAILWNDGRTFREKRLSESGDRQGEAFRIHGKHLLHRIYRAEDFVDEKQRAGELCTDQKDHAAEGLPGISSDRRTLHRCIGRFRHAVIRCEEPLLVGRNV